MSTEVELFEFQDIASRPSIRGYVGTDGAAKISAGGVDMPTYATDSTGNITGLVGPGGVRFTVARNWYTQLNVFAGNPLPNGTITAIGSSADRVSQVAGMRAPIVASNISRFGGNLQWGTLSTPEADYPGSSTDTVYTASPSSVQSSASAWLKHKDNGDGSQEYAMGRVQKLTTGELTFHQHADDALVSSCPRVQWYMANLINLGAYRIILDMQLGTDAVPWPAYVEGKDETLVFQLKSATQQPVMAAIVKYDSPTSNTLTVSFNIKQTSGGAITSIGSISGVAKNTRVRFELECFLTWEASGWWNVYANGQLVGSMTGNTLMPDVNESVQPMYGIYRYPYSTKAPDDCKVVFHEAGVEVLD